MVSDFTFLNPKRVSLKNLQETRLHFMTVQKSLPSSAFPQKNDRLNVLKKAVLKSPEEALYLLDGYEASQVNTTLLSEPDMSLELEKDYKRMPFSLSWTSVCHPFKKCLEQLTSFAARLSIHNFKVRKDNKQNSLFQAEGDFYTAASQQELSLQGAKTHPPYASREMNLKAFRLVGVLKNEDKTWALLANTSTSSIEKLKVGQMLRETPFKVIKITGNSVELRAGPNNRVRLSLLP